MSPEIAIRTQGLTKNYGKIRALRGVDLEVRCGEIFGFLGPNGAGKTTTIRCLLDMIRPTGGSLEVLGLDPQKDSLSVRRRAGYLPGELHLDENQSVEAALRHLNALRKGQADWNYTRFLAERLDLNLKTAVKNLSKGNKQKVGVVLALMHRPELLLLDEPTSGLDPLLQKEVLHMVQDARQHGATVFFSSHNLSEVQEIADRVGIIRRGELVETAETRTLVQRALRRVRLRLGQPISQEALDAIPGVSVLELCEGLTPLLQVEGKMDALIKALAVFPVIDFETERPSLEEVFLAYYAG